MQVIMKTSCSFIYSFCNPRQVPKSFDLLFTPQKNHHNHHSTCYIVDFLHRCVYTLQHISEDDNFYLVCRQNQSLTQPLHCNICHMEHLDYENLSLCDLFTFSTCHRCTCLLVASVLLPVFQVALTQPHSKSFHTESATLFPQRH